MWLLNYIFLSLYMVEACLSIRQEKGGNNMVDKKNEKIKVFPQDVTTQSWCSAHRDCCRLAGCKATFVPLSGATYVFDHCGCSGGGIA